MTGPTRGDIYVVNFDPTLGAEIRSIDRQRLVRRLGTANPETMTRVDLALRLSLGLAEV